MRIQSMQLAEGHEPVARGARNRDPWEARLIERYPNPHHQFALKTDLATIRHYDRMILDLEGQLLRVTRQIASRDFALLKTVPGIGEALALSILYKVQDIHRFDSAQRFCSYCRLISCSRTAPPSMWNNWWARCVEKTLAPDPRHDLNA